MKGFESEIKTTSHLNLDCLKTNRKQQKKAPDGMKARESSTENKSFRIFYGLKRRTASLIFSPL